MIPSNHKIKIFREVLLWILFNEKELWPPFMLHIDIEEAKQLLEQTANWTQIGLENSIVKKRKASIINFL